MIDKIVIKGARVHNLKNVDLEIPRDKLVVFTGLSGSGNTTNLSLGISKSTFLRLDRKSVV